MIDPPQQRTLPYSQESERAVLGAVLMAPALMDDISGRLVPEDFYFERHQLIFRAMQAIYPEPGIDLRTLQAHLERLGQGEMTGGLAALTGLDIDLPDISRADAYVEIVRERSLRRRGIQLSGDLMRRLFDGEERSATNTLSAMLASLDGLLTDATGGVGFRPLADYLEPLLARLEAGTGVIEGATSGIERLDKLVGAFQTKHLWLVGAYPRVGKTVLLEQILDRDVEAGYPVGFISLEMTAIEILERQIARRVRIPYERIRANRLTSKDWTRLIEARRELATREFYIEETPGLNIEEICARFRKLKRQHPRLRLVGVDYLSLVDREDSAAGREDVAINKLTRRLKNLAKELAVCCIVNCQLNRGGARGDDKPQLADIKDAGENDPDGIILLYRHKVDGNKALLRPDGSITVAKHRHGASGEVPAMLDGPHMRWSELDGSRPEPEAQEGMGSWYDKNG